MSVVRTLFLGTPDFARYHLEALLQDEHYKVVGVISQPDRPRGRKMTLQPSPVKVLAQENNIPVLTPSQISLDELGPSLKEWGAEVAIVVAFGQILPQSFLDFYPRRVVNVHASVLPRWRGAAPIQRAIMAGDSESGVSLQIVIKKLDAGDVIGIYKTPITDQDDAMSLHEKLKPLGAKLLHVDLMDFVRGNLSSVQQDESLVTYAHKIEKSERLIDWSQPAEQIFNQVRGLVMGPGTLTSVAGQALKIHKARIMDKKNSFSGKPGEIISLESEHFDVACGQGTLSVLEVQPESRPKMSVKDFLLGYRDKYQIEKGLLLDGGTQQKLEPSQVK